MPFLFDFEEYFYKVDAGFSNSGKDSFISTNSAGRKSNG